MVMLCFLVGVIGPWGGSLDDGSRIGVFNVKRLLETDRASLILREYRW